MSPQAAEATPAAGGVVWRTDGRGAVRIALVHRQRYDDWSLPKGKADRGEYPLQTAVREVGEEIGARVAVCRQLPDVRYRTAAGRKTVSYWAMRYLREMPVSGDEVDKIEWMGLKAARRRLTYELDRFVVADFAAQPVPDAMLLLVRHAKAGKRTEWRGDDLQRPLDLVGEQQALRLATFLRLFAPDRVYSADPVRCVQTVQPLADELGLPVRVRTDIGDLAWEADPNATWQAVQGLAKPGRVTVVSSQGDAIPGLIGRFAPTVGLTDTRKGAVWVLSLYRGAVLAADYYADPTALRT
ncbi:MAG: NUDIX hydrolase [Jatrophihabitans sp.]|uniref:NUDIX hydrolase n=1 Tax=Jatrophihabitans sp. TaxID=1932789 RepID=UPI003F7F9816